MYQAEPEIVLASQSPRRQDLLRQIGIRFTTIPVLVEEVPRRGELAVDYVCRVAAAKSAAGLADARSALPVLAADTEVVLDGHIMGKPRDLAHAAELLSQLSDRSHRVLSAVSLRQGEHHWTAVSETEVSLRAVEWWEIEAYWRTGEPCDKAGAYAIQGYGALFVRRIVGSYSGVVGLPLFETAELLRHVGINALRMPQPGSRIDER